MYHQKGLQSAGMNYCEQLHLIGFGCSEDDYDPECNSCPFNVSDEQIELLKHALKHKSNQSKGWFGTTTNSSDYIQWEHLTEKGYADKRKAPAWVVDEWIYYVTEDGEKLVEGVKNV